MDKKPDDRPLIRKKAMSGGVGSKEDLGGATSKPAMISRGMFPPAGKAQKDIDAGRVTDIRKKRHPDLDDFEKKSRGL